MSSRALIRSLVDRVEGALKRDFPNRVYSKQDVTAFLDSADLITSLRFSFIVREHGYSPLKIALTVSRGGCVWESN